MNNSFATRDMLTVGDQSFEIFSLRKLNAAQDITRSQPAASSMPSGMPFFSIVSSVASDASLRTHSSMKAAISGLFAAAFAASGCSAATAMYVTPMSVSGRVVKTTRSPSTRVRTPNS